MIKFLRRLKGRKIFKSMFIACFSLAAACILASCIFGFGWFYTTHLEEEKETDINVLYASSLMLNNYLTSATDTMEVFMSDTYVRRLLVKNEYSWDDNMSIAAKQILSTVAVNPNYHSIYLLGEDEYLIKSTNPSYPLSQKEDELMENVFFQSTYGRFTPYYYQDVYGKSISLLCLSDGGKNPQNGKKESGILISLDMGKIMTDIFSSYRLNEQYLLLDQQGVILFVQGDETSLQKNSIDEQMYHFIEGIDKKDSAILKVNSGEKYMVTCVKTEANLSLVHLLPYSYILTPIVHMGIIFIFIGILLVLIVLLLAFAMSNWVYDPIDAVVQTTQSGGATAGGFAEERLKKTELANIAQTYYAMVQDLNDLNMQKDLTELAHYLTNKRAGNHLPEWVEETYAKNGIRIRMFCLRISDTTDFTTNNTEEAIAFEFQTITNIVKQLLKPLGDVLTATIDKEYIAVILFTEQSLSDTESVQKGEEIVRLVKELIQVGIDAGISNEKTQFQELAAMYQMARAATAYRFMYGVNAVITENQMTERALSNREGINLEQLLRTLRESDREGFTKEYQRIIQELKGYSLQAARDALVTMAAEIQKFSNSLHYHFTELSNSDYERILNELLKFDYIDDVQEWFFTMVEQIWLDILRAKQNSRDDVADKAMVYLNENYSNPNISAQYLADMYHITPSYFSRIFNERSGYAFPDYLATLRIEQAKELLLSHPNKSIQEICELVGYTNSSYFTASFKKKFGITPGQFRKTNTKSKENE